MLGVRKTIVIICILLVISVRIALAQEERPTKPSEILKWAEKKTEQMVLSEQVPVSQFNEARNKLINEALYALDPQRLPREELPGYCEMLALVGRDDEAKGIYARLQEGADLAAQIATARLAGIAAREGDIAGAEALVKRYYDTFQPNPDFPENLSNALSAICGYYRQKEEYPAAARLIIKEFEWLPDGGEPFSSYYLAARYWSVMINAGMKQEFGQLLSRKVAALEKAGARAVADTEEEQQRLDDIRSMAGMLERTRTQTNLTGSYAPSLAFVASLNDPIEGIESLRGKVVLLDFWATWCKPCIAAFPHMAEIYSEFKDQGFQILGVTSFQTSISYSQLNALDMTREEELKAVRDFLAYYKVTWPIAFLDESVMGLEAYGVSGIPTFALLDKKGVIRQIKLGSSAKNADELRAMIAKLLAE